MRDGVRADLVISNNVLAQVPDLNDFVAGVKRSSSPTVSSRWSSASNDLDPKSSSARSTAFVLCDLAFRSPPRRCDVDEVPHPLLRICRPDEAAPAQSDAARLSSRSARRSRRSRLLPVVRRAGGTDRTPWSFIEQKQAGKRVVGYGAPGKGNTLLNYCGVRSDLLEFTVDRSPHKQGMFLPGTRIPIYEPEKISEARPDFILILPWNIKDEIVQQLEGVAEWGAKFVTAIPEVHVLG